jgi:hypothetical protein
MKKLMYSATIFVILSGCAQTPPVTIGYYPAKASLSARLVRTLGCDKDNLPVVATAPTVTVTQVADTSKLLSLDFSALDGEMANSDIKLEFFADRRLKTVNATTTGQGEAILKSAISLIASVNLAKTDDAPLIAECKEFKKHFGEQTLTLIYTAETKFDNFDEVLLVADAQSSRFASLYPKLIGDACIRATAEKATAPVTLATTGKNYTMLRARQPALVPATVSVGPEGACQMSTVWSDYVPVGQNGVDYAIPVPSGALFGKQVFAAAFDESGALILIQYGKENGTGAAVNVAQSAFDAFHTTDTEKLTQLRNEADIIAAQQRLVKCKTTPSSC